MLRMFVNGHEAVYGEKDIVVFVLDEKDRELIAGMDELSTCLAIYDPEKHDREEVSAAITRVKQICAISPLTRA